MSGMVSFVFSPTYIMYTINAKAEGLYMANNVNVNNSSFERESTSMMSWKYVGHFNIKDSVHGDAIWNGNIPLFVCKTFLTGRIWNLYTQVKRTPKLFCQKNGNDLLENYTYMCSVLLEGDWDNWKKKKKKKKEKLNAMPHWPSLHFVSVTQKALRLRRSHRCLHQHGAPGRYRFRWVPSDTNSGCAVLTMTWNSSRSWPRRKWTSAIASCWWSPHHGRATSAR